MLSALCAILIAGCGKIKSVEPQALAEAINDNVTFDDYLSVIDSDGAEKYFYLNPNDYTELVAYVGTDATCDEFIIVKTNDVQTIRTKLEEHIGLLRDLYETYRPDETAKLDTAFIETYKDAVVMIISPSPEQAQSTFKSYIKK